MMRRGIGRVGRPRLVGTMARTAVIAGTATAVSGGVRSRQQAKAQAQEQDYQEAQAATPLPPPPPPAGGASAPAAGMTDESIEQLKKLAELKDQGILSEEEFTAKKEQILGI
jgi:hypothetical protein